MVHYLKNLARSELGSSDYKANYYKLDQRVSK